METEKVHLIGKGRGNHKGRITNNNKGWIILLSASSHLNNLRSGKDIWCDLFQFFPVMVKHSCVECMVLCIPVHKPNKFRIPDLLQKHGTLLALQCF